MGFRVIKINGRCKLETQLGYLVCRKETEQKVLLDEISLLIIENQQICITSALISELMNHKIRVIFCDSTHNPQGEIQPYFCSYDSYEKTQVQLSWKQETKDLVWKTIVYQKIANQIATLQTFHMESNLNLLYQYLNSIDSGDVTNREGLAAKLYFSSLFGKDFARRDNKDKRNTYLNYGYSLLLAAVNREISSFGYLNQIGIHHIGKQNPFNLGCDFIEPFRPFVDTIAIQEDINESNYKRKMLELFNLNINVGDKRMIMENGIYAFVLAVLTALKTGNITLIPKVHISDHE